MPDQPIDKARKLQKLGERLRDAFTKEHPAPDRSIEIVRQTIRQEWEKERTTKLQKPITPAKDRGPSEPREER